MGSMDLTYDANLDGQVNTADVLYWLTDLRQAIPGDADLNDIVDGLDFIAWNAHKFTTGGGWCGGDFDSNQIVDGLDFIVWNPAQVYVRRCAGRSRTRWLWVMAAGVDIFSAIREMKFQPETRKKLPGDLKGSGTNCQR